MKIIAIVCINYNDTIGWKDTNQLVFYIPNELAYFRKTTTFTENGKPNIIVMGSNTWNSLPKKPLPYRENCIITSTPDKYNIYKEYENFKAFPSLPDFIEYFQTNNEKYNNINIIGGYSLYEYFIKHNLVDELHITRITTPNNLGDIYFPKIDFNNFTVKSINTFSNIDAINTNNNEKIKLDYEIKVYTKN